MTAQFVGGVAVVTDQPTRSPLKAHNHGEDVYWEQIRHLLLENEKETHGCKWDSFTADDPYQVLVHLRKCPNKPAKPQKPRNEQQQALPVAVPAAAPAPAAPTTPARRSVPPAHFEAPLPTVRIKPTNAGPAAPAKPAPIPARADAPQPPSRPAAQPAAPVSPAPASAVLPSLTDLVERLARIPELERENERLRKQVTDWKRRAKTAEGLLNEINSAFSGTKIRRNARPNL